MFNWIADNVFKRSLFRAAREIRERKPLFSSDVFYDATNYQLYVINPQMERQRWRFCLFSIESDGMHLYPETPKMDIHIHFTRESLRWFGRPEKYNPDKNDMWLHFESGGLWHWLHLKTHKAPMERIVRAMKQVATPEQVKAYRRHRPYVHYGPLPARFGEQDLYGAWLVYPDTLSLYLTPLQLVVMDGENVRRVLPLEKIQQIEVMRRVDEPDSPAGVVRFKVGEEIYAYIMRDYIGFGAALIEAAKRSLEDPPQFYGKKKDMDEDE